MPGTLIYMNSFNIHNCSVKYCIVISAWPFQPGVTVYVSLLSDQPCPELDTKLSGSETGSLCGHSGVNRPRQIDSF